MQTNKSVITTEKLGKNLFSWVGHILAPFSIGAACGGLAVIFVFEYLNISLLFKICGSWVAQVAHQVHDIGRLRCTHRFESRMIFS